jgi:hypothetical protein
MKVGRTHTEEMLQTADSKNYFVIFVNESRSFFLQECALNIVSPLTLLETSGH